MKLFWQCLDIKSGRREEKRIISKPAGEIGRLAQEQGLRGAKGQSRWR